MWDHKNAVKKFDVKNGLEIHACSNLFLASYQELTFIYKRHFAIKHVSSLILHLYLKTNMGSWNNLYICSGEVWLYFKMGRSSMKLQI